MLEYESTSTLSSAIIWIWGKPKVLSATARFIVKFLLPARVHMLRPDCYICCYVHEFKFNPSYFIITSSTEKKVLRLLQQWDWNNNKILTRVES
jgi:hypothetical protein